MKRSMLASIALLSLPLTINAAEISTYEVPSATKESNEMEFYEKSLKHEDALSSLQLVLIVDRSGSQQATDKHPEKQDPGKGMLGDTWTQWDNTFYAAKYLAESIFEYDSDGEVPLVFFGNSATDCVTKGIGEMLVQFKKHKPTNETTNLMSALEIAFSKYSAPKKDDEKTLFIVLTDGSPNAGQNEAVKKMIQQNITSRDLGKDKLNILFIRVGDDPGAISFLKDLDDCQEIGDAVDTKSDDMIYKMGPKNLILNAIYEHLDGQFQE